MRSLLVATLVGVCGSIVFETINRWAGWITTSDPTRWIVLGGIFFLLFIIAVLLDKGAVKVRAHKNVASGNISNAKQDIEVGDVTVRAISDSSIGSENKAKGDQKIIIGKVEI